ncbi:hypothetical protein A9W97_25975 [Mycobacterium gordonae]|nr:hypothetical protein A9W97_25975 [Mycobacterium gordonae]
MYGYARHWARFLAWDGYQFSLVCSVGALRAKCQYADTIDVLGAENCQLGDTAAAGSSMSW